MLNITELIELEEKLKPELQDKLLEILTLLNRTEKLEDFLSMIGMSDLLHLEDEYKVLKNGKILIIGQSNVQKKDLLSVARKANIDEARIEAHLNYYDAKKYNFKSIQWDVKYSVIMVGPMPHMGKGIGNESNIISYLEKTPGFPPVIRLGKNKLEISKDGFKKALNECINKQIVLTDLYV